MCKSRSRVGSYIGKSKKTENIDKRVNGNVMKIFVYVRSMRKTSSNKTNRIEFNEMQI